MKIRRRHREGTEVSTDSLNDIMFFLLIFFLIVSTLANPSVIKINLPNSKKNISIETKSIVLAVNKDLQYFINNKPVDVINLESELISAVKEMKEPTVILKVDNGLTVQDLVNVMQIGAKLKVKMVLGTKPPNAG
ncbi:MAG: biopolymer transporter ExbD [Bacteroidetes bacterium]|nr:biopolymer transporter ExbD [Bacteroidota bacterium]